MEPAFSIELAMEKYKNAEEVPVTCGGLTGLLLLKKFFCPAIHRACIKFNGEIVTPKQFCIMGDKQKLKDWKNAIRIEGFPLRKYIETGQLDFYRHSEFCTGRCTARTPLNRSSNISNIASEANATTVVEPVASVVPSGERITIADTLYQRFFPSAVENEDDGTISVKETAKQVEDRKPPQIKRECGVSTSSRSQASPVRLSAANATKLQPASSLSSSTLPAASSSTWRMKLAAAKAKTQPDKHQVFEIEDGIEVVTVSSTQLSDDQQFWLGIVEQNLCDLVFQEIHSALESMKQDLITYCVRGEGSHRLKTPFGYDKLVITQSGRKSAMLNYHAYCLSNVVRELGLMGNLKDKLADIKHHMDLQQASIANEMLELKKKVAEFEAKKLALKRKSDKFNYLIEVTKAKKQRKMKVVPDVAESSLLGSSSSEGSDEEQPPPKSAKHGVFEKEQTLPRSSEKSGRNASKTASSAVGSKKTLSSTSAKAGSGVAKGDADAKVIRRSNAKDTSDATTSTFKTAATVNSAAYAADVSSHSNATREHGDKSGCHKKQVAGKEESQGGVLTKKGIILENKTEEIDHDGKPACLLTLEDLTAETCTDKEVLEESAFKRSEEDMEEGSTGADNSIEERTEIVQSGSPSALFVEKGSTDGLDSQKETNCDADNLDVSSGREERCCPELDSKIDPKTFGNKDSPDLAGDEKMLLLDKAKVEPVFQVYCTERVCTDGEVSKLPSSEASNISTVALKLLAEEETGLAGGEKPDIDTVVAKDANRNVHCSDTKESKPMTVQTSTQVNSWEPFHSRTAFKTLSARATKLTKANDLKRSINVSEKKSRFSCSTRKTFCRFCGRDRGTCIHMLPNRSKLEIKKKKNRGKILSSGKKSKSQHKAMLSGAKKKLVARSKALWLAGKSDESGPENVRLLMSSNEVMSLQVKEEGPSRMNSEDENSKSGKISDMTKTTTSCIKLEKQEGIHDTSAKSSETASDDAGQKSFGSNVVLKSASEDGQKLGSVKTESSVPPEISVSHKLPETGSRPKITIISKESPDLGKNIASGYRTIVLPPQAKIPVALLQSLIKTGGTSPTKIAATGGDKDQMSGLSPSGIVASSKDMTVVSKACLPGGKNTRFILGIKTSEAAPVSSASSASKFPGRVQLVAVIPPIDSSHPDASVQSPAVRLRTSCVSKSTPAASRGKSLITAKMTSSTPSLNQRAGKTTDTPEGCKSKKRVQIVSTSSNDKEAKGVAEQKQPASLPNSKVLSKISFSKVDSKPSGCHAKVEKTRMETKLNPENLAASKRQIASKTEKHSAEDTALCSEGRSSSIPEEAESSASLLLAKTQEEVGIVENSKTCTAVEGATSHCLSPFVSAPPGDDVGAGSRRSARRQPQLPAKYRDPQLLLPRKYSTSNSTTSAYEDIEKLNSKRV